MGWCSPAFPCSASFSVINLSFSYLNPAQTPSLLSSSAWLFAPARNSRKLQNQDILQLSYPIPQQNAQTSWREVACSHWSFSKWGLYWDSRSQSDRVKGGLKKKKEMKNSMGPQSPSCGSCFKPLKSSKSCYILFSEKR